MTSHTRLTNNLPASPPSRERLESLNFFKESESGEPNPEEVSERGLAV